MKVKTDIHRMCSGLDEQHYKELEIDSSEGFDTERMKRLALAKLHSEGGMEEQGRKVTMKRAPYKIMIAVAVIAVFTTAAFAASGMDFFKFIFEKSERQLEENVQQVGISAKDANFEMTAEQLISDGFNTKIIASLTPLSKEAKEWLNSSELEVGLVAGSTDRKEDNAAMTSSERLGQFDTEEKAYFCATYASSSDYTGEPIALTLRLWDSESGKLMKMEAEDSELSLVIEHPKSIDEQKRVIFEASEEKKDSTYPISLTVNSISAVLILQEPDGSTDTPTMNVTLVTKDGVKESIFEAGWIAEGGSGGGGVVMADDPAELPLANGHSYRRNLETSQIVQTSNFSRILDLKDVDYVLVDGTRYDFQ